MVNKWLNPQNHTLSTQSTVLKNILVNQADNLQSFLCLHFRFTHVIMQRGATLYFSKAESFVVTCLLPSTKVDTASNPPANNLCSKSLVCLNFSILVDVIQLWTPSHSFVSGRISFWTSWWVLQHSQSSFGKSAMHENPNSWAVNSGFAFLLIAIHELISGGKPKQSRATTSTWLYFCSYLALHTQSVALFLTEKVKQSLIKY